MELHGYSGLSTKLVHAGQPKNKPEGAVITPIFQTATFGYHGPDDRPADEYGCFYTRPADNPNLKILAKKLASLEGTEDALVFSSGMAAITSSMLALLQPGDHFLTQGQLYGASYFVFFSELKRLGIDLTIVDTMRPESWEAALRPNTKVFYVESMSNPLLEVGDLRSVAAFSRRHGLTAVIDSTFAPPINFRPAAVGFDVVLHSATKYANGHSDIVGGIAAGSRAFVSKLTEKLLQYGGVMDPHAAFLLTRGLATLALRVARQNETGLAVARYLAAHPKVKQVFYPGLEGCSGHEHAKELFSGYGGVVSAELHGGAEAATAFMHGLRLPMVAVSLGGIESLVCVPAQTTHRVMSAEARQAAKISDSLVRMAFGIEDTDDLIKDIGDALACIGQPKAANGILHS